MPTTFEPTYIISDGAISHSSTPAISGYTPVQIRTAYGVNSVEFDNSQATGAGTTIAIVDAYNDPNIVSDLNTFDEEFSITSGGATLYSLFGAASSFLTVYNQSGTNITSDIANSGKDGVPGVDSTGGWEMEEALDVEWAHAIAPGANIVLVEANNSGNNLYTAVQTAAGLAPVGLPAVSVVSMSWGSAEFSGEQSYDSYFTTPANHIGVTFLAAAGDDSYGLYPAFSPNVIAAGGTTLTLTASNTISTQTAWTTGSDSYGPDYGTGGGTSAYELEPAYQDSVNSTGYREIPDMAWDADPSTGVAIYDSYKNSSPWVQIGGTSVASPSLAGVMALANEGRELQNLSTFSTTSSSQQALTAIYSMPGDFYDITSGHITANGKTYTAGVGYDEVSGFGTPEANLLVPALASYGAASATTPYELGFTAEPPSSIAVGTAFSTTVQIENSSAGALSDDNVSVTLTLSSGVFSTTDTKTMTTSTGPTGSVSFSVDVTVGGTYTVTASAPSLVSATSTSFTESTGATKLAFTTSPPTSSVAVGTAFTVVVQVENASGVAVADSGVNVTITLSSGTFSNGATTMSLLTGSTGAASFSVIVTATGTYTLTATSSPVLTSTKSSSFSVTSSASKLAFSTPPPTSATKGVSFPVVVQLENSSNVAVTQSGVSVTLTLSSSTGATVATATGTTNASGQVSFTVTVNTTGSNYTVSAKATGFTTVKSNTFSVVNAPAKAGVPGFGLPGDDFGASDLGLAADNAAALGLYYVLGLDADSDELP